MLNCFIDKGMNDYLFTLAEDVVSHRVSSQFVNLSFAEKPLKFKDAPEDELLLVMGDYLKGCSRSDNGERIPSLLKGSVISKMSKNFKEIINIESLIPYTIDKEVIYSELAFEHIIKSDGRRAIKTVTESTYLIESELASDCYVVPLNRVLSCGKTLLIQNNR